MANLTFALRSGRRVGVTTLGDPSASRVVVFCHPAPGSSVFDPDPDASADHDVHIVALDRPGYGSSDPWPAGTWPGIARAAARLFTNGDTIFIDTGTTTLFFAEELAHFRNLSVVTNSSAIAARLSGSGNNVFLLGGFYQADAGETIGPTTIQQIASFHASHAVLTIGAIHPKNGVMDFSLDEAQVARAMIEHADHVTVIADRSKVGRGAFGTVCTLDAIDRFVTDVRPGPAMTEALLQAGVEIIVAD